MSWVPQVRLVRLAALGASVATALALVAGCTSSSDSSSSPDLPMATTPSAEPTSTPAVDPLAIPAAVRKKTSKGAEAAVRHYFAMYDHLLRTGDAKPIRKLYQDYCSLCRTMVSMIELPYEEGNRWTGEQDLKMVTVTQAEKENGVAVAQYRQTALIQRSPKGDKVVQLPGGRGSFIFLMRFHNGFWTIASLEVPRS